MKSLHKFIINFHIRKSYIYVILFTLINYVIINY